MADMQQNYRSENSNQNNPENSEENGTKAQNITEGEEQQPIPLTQTDHLNKSLLNSFLDRLNQPDSRFPVVQSVETEDSAQPQPQEDLAPSDMTIPEH